MKPCVVNLPITGISHESLHVDKGLVWDDAKGVYRVIAADLAKVPVWQAKPPPPLRWWQRKTVMVACSVGSVALLFIVATGWALDAQRYNRNLSRLAAKHQALPAASSSAFAMAPAMSASAPVAAMTTVKDETPATNHLRFPNAAQSQETEVLTADRPKTLPLKSKPATAAKPIQLASKTPLMASKEAASGALTSSITLAQRSWPVAVQKDGIQFFDGKETKLYKPGDRLPNGEKIVDVDEGSATFATDKGVRQIRSSKLKESTSP